MSDSVEVTVTGRPLSEVPSALAAAPTGQRVRIGGGQDAGTWVRISQAFSPYLLNNVWCNVSTGELRSGIHLGKGCTGMIMEPRTAE
jgi:hypothetical protein